MANLQSPQNQTNVNVQNDFQMEGSPSMINNVLDENKRIAETNIDEDGIPNSNAEVSRPMSSMSPHDKISGDQPQLNWSSEVRGLFGSPDSQMAQELVGRNIPTSNTPPSGSVLDGSSLHLTEIHGDNSPFTSPSQRVSSPFTNQVNHAEANMSISLFMENFNSNRFSMIKLLSVAQKISETIRSGSACYSWTFSSDVVSGSAPPLSDEGKVAYYEFISYFQSRCSEETVKHFCNKLAHIVCKEGLTKPINQFLLLFWKRVELVIRNKTFSRFFEQDRETLLAEILILLGENDLLGCVKNLLRITNSAKDFQFLVMESDSFDRNIEASVPKDEPTMSFVKFIRLLMISHPKGRVQEFCDKLNQVIRLREEFDQIKKRLIFFWKRFLYVIESQFAPGEVEFSQNLLTTVDKYLDEICEECDLVHMVKTIATSMMDSNIPYHWRRIFQKEGVLIETMGDDAGRATYCKLIRILHFSHSEESVHELCDELSQAICNEKAAESDIRKRLLVFWNRVLCLIENKLPLAGTEFKRNLLTEIRKTMTITLTENKLILCSVEGIIQALDASNNQCHLRGIFYPKNVTLAGLTAEEIEARLAYSDFNLLLNLETDGTQKFCNQLYETLREKSASNSLRELCITFWKRVFCFVDDIPTLESDVDCSNQLIDTILELLNDTFFGEDTTTLCANILKCVGSCRNQHSLLWIFQVDVVFHKPPINELNRLDYYRFVQRLKFCNGKEKVQSFCNRLYDSIKSEKNAEIVHTLVTIFWIRVECSIRDDFDFLETSSDCYETMFEKASEFLDDTFKGDNCITKFSACHACCNCFCIQCATWFHEWYYKKVFKNSLCFRKHCPNILDKCCTPTCFIISLFFAIITTVTILFAFIFYFKLVMMDWLFQL